MAAAQKSSYRNLMVWQKAVDLSVAVYGVTTCLPRDERFGLISQMRDAASSVPANIAEGAARGSAGDFVRFLRIAAGSLAELDTFVEICSRLQYLAPAQIASAREAMAEVGKMLHGLIASVERRSG